MLKLLSGFRDFIVRGNVVDLAVGIVIGAAFTGLVTSFTNAFIEPLSRSSAAAREERQFQIFDVVFPWSNFVNAVIGFLITAAVLYFLVVTPMNMIDERRRRGIEPEPKLPERRGQAAHGDPRHPGRGGRRCRRRARRPTSPATLATVMSWLSRLISPLSRADTEYASIV